jgi:phage shock protein PspC (stress-responsive transcriptional regulator)
MVSIEVIKLFFGLLLIGLGGYGSFFGLSVLPMEFALTIIIVFGSMLVVGVALYLKAMITLYRKKKQQPSK